MSAFRYLGGVPQSILYDNSKIASPRYWEEDVGAHEYVHGASSHYLFSDRFGRVGKGNVQCQGMVGYRRNFLVPIPELRCAQRAPGE